MKKALALCSLFVFYTHASEIPTKTTAYPFIQPIAVEEASTEMILQHDSDEEGIVDKNDSTLLHDADNDGVPDAEDQCPNTASGIQVDKKGCEIDSDADGISDSRDKCPNTSKEFIVDGYGCPQTANLNVHFESGKADVDDTLLKQLETFALFLKENQGYQVVIYGYTDNAGDPQTNKLLSQRRAQAVKEGLIRYEINETRLTSIGMGDTNPIAENDTPQGRATNRRIEIELIQ